jgi:hypothetical protein
MYAYGTVVLGPCARIAQRMETLNNSSNKAKKIKFRAFVQLLLAKFKPLKIESSEQQGPRYLIYFFIDFGKLSVRATL